MTAKTQSHKFQAEVQELLDLMIHSLYSNREIFLRELISNASDALDRMHFESLTREELRGDAEELYILIEVDPELRLVRVIDNGIGMDREELVENIGTIARSGTRLFKERLQEAGTGASADLPELIGQFGVGFYSSFTVADAITLETCKAGDSQGLCWRSAGDGEYSLEEQPEAEAGTAVTLHLREEDDGEELDGYLSPLRLAELVRKYSDFVEYPIFMDVKHFEDRHDLEQRTIEEDRKVVTLNSMKPLWAQDKAEIEPEEYAKFYQHIAHDWSEPLETIHFKAEGALDYTALLYLPRQRPLDFFDPSRDKSRISLYVRRVFVMADCEGLLPPWLRFVRGIVEAQDLPLNVSREILQENRSIPQIRTRLVKKVLDALERMLRERREDYAAFFAAFGPVLKEGIVLDQALAERVAGLALYPSSAQEQETTLDAYLDRMPAEQEHIYFLPGSDRASVESSPHLEAVRARGFEVLFMLDPVDEWVSQRLSTYREKPLQSLAEGEVALDDGADQEQKAAQEREYRPLLEAIEGHLEQEVKEVRFSSRLTDSVAVLVSDEGAPGKHMEMLLRQQHGDLPRSKRILELNAGHPLVQRLDEMHGEDAASTRLKDYCDLLYGQALLCEGSRPPDPGRFARLVTELMAAAP